MDSHVGRQIRAHRLATGITQARLAADIAVSLQQLQKYEHGMSSVSVALLADIARALDVPVETFFDRPPIGRTVPR